jgi:hypothetical protein
MVQLQQIYSVIAWERELEYTEERRQNHRAVPYVNYLAAPQPHSKENKHHEAGRAPADFVKALNPNL